MPANGGVGTVEPLMGDRPESAMTARSPQKGHHPGPGQGSTPHFLEKIGNVKTAHDGIVLEKNAGSNGSRTKDEATERAPWLRVGLPSAGGINHVTQVWHSQTSGLPLVVGISRPC